MLAFCLAARTASTATILFSPFDSLDGWQVRSAGPTAAELVQEGKRQCVQIASQGGTVFLTRELPLDAVKGRQLMVRCEVKADGVTRGPQVSSTAKVHVAVRTPAGIQHHTARFTGTAPWHEEALKAAVPADAQQVRLNVGLEACSGRAWFDTLVVRNDQQGVHPVPLASAANAHHSQLVLPAFPKGRLEWQGIPFDVLDGNAGMDCLRLSGVNHPDWPAQMSAPVSVNAGASTIYILHAALDGQPSRETPTAIWTATLSDGYEASFSVFEGREIGAVGQTKDLENWRVAWRGQGVDGKPVAFGVTKWALHSESPVVSLKCRTYRGAAPVVLAVTVVEDPPRERPTSSGEEEGE
ncbi:MAG: hypothetical protein FJ272_07650 [Planctomycetes bacterium]|nr:hypothetical protein [Planctomycetota bacterium]MBM4084647.1 hypothetical protein [Planctomycetota bacterium]